MHSTRSCEDSRIPSIGSVTLVRPLPFHVFAGCRKHHRQTIGNSLTRWWHLLLNRTCCGLREQHRIAQQGRRHISRITFAENEPPQREADLDRATSSSPLTNSGTQGAAYHPTPSLQVQEKASLDIACTYHSDNLCICGLFGLGRQCQRNEKQEHSDGFPSTRQLNLPKPAELENPDALWLSGPTMALYGDAATICIEATMDAVWKERAALLMAPWLKVRGAPRLPGAC